MIQLDQILKVTNSELDSLDTKFVDQYLFYHDNRYFHLSSGKEHYRLLMYISKLYNKSLFFDIGTAKCMSTAALSYSFKNRIRSYDLRKDLIINPLLPGVCYFIGDALRDENLIKSEFIFLDTNHDGIFENQLYNHLDNIKWKGLLLLDDIYLEGPMTNFWNSIDKEKYDISKNGHWSRTGICLF